MRQKDFKFIPVEFLLPFPAGCPATGIATVTYRPAGSLWKVAERINLLHPRHNEQPKERADFYIAQNVGSMLEEENQRGLALLPGTYGLQRLEKLPGQRNGRIYPKHRHAYG